MRRAMPLLMAVSIAFGWIVWPYIGSIFWALVLAILFAPLHRSILALARQRGTVAALATLFVAMAGVGIPMALIAASLLRQAASLYADVAARRIDFSLYGQRIVEGLPSWAHVGLDALGLDDLSAIQQQLAASAGAAVRFIASQMLGFGLDAVELAVGLGVMLYLLFFLLRDGDALAARIENGMPLATGDAQALGTVFVVVVRATVKGGVAMAATQGALGGAMLGWLGIQGPLFWGVVFGLLSMLPAIGASLLWAPIAVYFIVTGAVWKGVVLTFFGVVVLTVVDNTLRPLLVGRETRLPGYLVLISTLGGIAACGLNGVVVGPVIAATFVAAWSLFSTPARAERV